MFKFKAGAMGVVIEICMKCPPKGQQGPNLN